MNIHKEVVHAVRVLVEHDSANVTDGFSEDTNEKGAHVCPRLLADAIEELGREQHKEA
jgi:hypothetical protein